LRQILGLRVHGPVPAVVAVGVLSRHRSTADSLPPCSRVERRAAVPSIPRLFTHETSRAHTYTRARSPSVELERALVWKRPGRFPVVQ
jgi:hypothetical protein